MAWSQNGGGSPGGNPGGNPWGTARRPRSSGGGSSGGGSGGGSFSFDNVFSDFLSKVGDFFDPQGEHVARRVILVVFGAFLLWLASGLYRVDQGEVGVPLIFGKYYGPPRGPGLNYNPPAPFGRVFTPQVARARRLDIGFRSARERGSILTDDSTNAVDIAEESLILTKDQNIVDIDFTVFWKITDPIKYLFNIRDQQATIKIASESAMREVIGQTSFDDAVTVGRAEIETNTLALLQRILDSYDSGVLIEKIDLQKSSPPPQVIDSFNDVQRARQDLDRLRNQAEAYANSIVPEARGEAEQMLRQAEAYSERLTLEAEGEAARFTEVLRAYRSAPSVTRRRMYLETLSSVFERSNMVIIDNNARGVVPFLPLPEVQRRLRAGSGGGTAKQPSP